jgi:putative heme transporter
MERGSEPEESATHLAVPRPVRVAADWSWRLLVISAAVVAALLLAYRLKLVLLALFVALLLAALLAPAVRWTQRVAGGSRGFATAAVLVLTVGLLLGIAALLAIAVSNSFSSLGTQLSAGLVQIRHWLRDTFGIDDAHLQAYLQRAWTAIQANRGGLLSGALSGTRIALEVISGAAIALFATVFFLLDGESIWAWCVSLFPRRSQAGVGEVGGRAWLVLTAYIRGTVLIAFVDAVSIGLAIAIIRVPLALPLAVLVFFFSFVPIVGAFVSGFVAVVVALASRGVLAALAVLVAIIVVQQVEGHLLQPLVMGRLVRIHPVGAVVAVPMVAVATVVLSYYGRLARAEDETDPDTPAPAAGTAAEPGTA